MPESAPKFDPTNDSDLLYGTALLEAFRYEPDHAKRLILEYKCKFMNADYCKTIGWVTRDDRVIRRFLGPLTLATEIRIFIGEQRPPDASHDPMNFDPVDPDDDEDLIFGTGHLEAFGYTADAARRMILAYKHKFMNEAFCAAAGIPIQLNEFVQHEGPAEMAALIHYYIGLGGDPNPDAMVAWRCDFGKTEAYEKWRAKHPRWTENGKGRRQW
jgi:hypothetical protein